MAIGIVVVEICCSSSRDRASPHDYKVKWLHALLEPPPPSPQPTQPATPPHPHPLQKEGEFLKFLQKGGEGGSDFSHKKGGVGQIEEVF